MHEVERLFSAIWRAHLRLGRRRNAERAQEFSALIGDLIELLGRDDIAQELDSLMKAGHEHVGAAGAAAELIGGLSDAEMREELRAARAFGVKDPKAKKLMRLAERSLHSSVARARRLEPPTTTVELVALLEDIDSGVRIAMSTTGLSAGKARGDWRKARELSLARCMFVLANAAKRTNFNVSYALTAGLSA